MSSLSLRNASVNVLRPHRVLSVVLNLLAMRRSRIALSRLDARLLEDIGVTARQADGEARKALWID